MKPFLICSLDQILLKALHGILRDEGYEVEVADHPAQAARMALSKDYAGVFLDSEFVGLSAQDAAKIISSTSDTHVLIAGEVSFCTGAIAIGKPLDLQEVRQAIHGIKDLQGHERSSAYES